MGYEGRSNINSAADWDKGGRPDIVSPASLYGVTALTVTQEQGEPSPVYVAAYEKWNPVSSSDTGASLDQNVTPQSEGHAVKDRVFLRKDKGDWVIYRIDRLETNPLPAPKTVPAPAESESGALQPGGIQ
jgi:hypothetical protein